MFAGREPAGGLDRVLDCIPPAAGAEVMGTGIESAALSLDGDETLSRTLLVIAAAMWVTLAVLVPMRAGRDRVRFLADQESSRAGAVTGVGVERGRPGDWSLGVTADVAAGEFEMTRRVRKRSRSATPRSSTPWLVWSQSDSAVGDLSATRDQHHEPESSSCSAGSNDDAPCPERSA